MVRSAIRNSRFSAEKKKDTMNPLDALQLVTVAIVAIWGIYQTRVTKRLEQQIHRLNIGLDQTIQLLHRAREAVIKIHSARVFMLEYAAHQEKPNELYMTTFADMSSYEAELAGLASAIGDEELIVLVNKPYEFDGKPIEARVFEMDEVEIRGRSRRLHTRISQLLEAATK